MPIISDYLLAGLIPHRSRNTEAQDLGYAKLVAQAIMDRLHEALPVKPTYEEVAFAIQPYPMPSDEEELKRLMWLAERLWAIRPQCPSPVTVSKVAGNPAYSLAVFGVEIKKAASKADVRDMHLLADELRTAFKDWGTERES